MNSTSINAQARKSSGRSPRPPKDSHLQMLLAIGLCIGGWLLLLIGLYAPPFGSIDGSVLIAFGEICTFVGALIGIDYRYRWRR